MLKLIGSVLIWILMTYHKFILDDVDLDPFLSNAILGDVVSPTLHSKVITGADDDLFPTDQNVIKADI